MYIYTWTSLGITWPLRWWWWWTRTITATVSTIWIVTWPASSSWLYSTSTSLSTLSIAWPSAPRTPTTVYWKKKRMKSVMKRTFKQWWSTILPILTKRISTSHLTELNNKRPRHIELKMQVMTSDYPFVILDLCLLISPLVS